MTLALEQNALYEMELQKSDTPRDHKRDSPREPAVKVVRDQLTDLKVRQPVLEPVFDSVIGRQ